MSVKKSTQVYRTDMVSLGIARGQKETVPYLSGTTEYDESGRPTLQVTFSPEGVITEKTILGYDEAGRVIRQLHFSEEEEGAGEKSFDYDSSGKVLAEKTHYLDGSIDTTSYLYNQQNQLVEKVTHSEDGENEGVEHFRYSGEHLIEHEIVDGDGERVSIEQFEYSTAGKMLMHQQENDETGEFFRLKVEYDVAGRRIAERFYDDEDNLLETTYFTEGDKGEVLQTIEEQGRSRKVKDFQYDEQGLQLGYTETNERGEQIVVVSHQYDSAGNPLHTLVFVNGGGRVTGSQHYTLDYRHEWYD